MRRWIDLVEGTQGHIYGDEGLQTRIPEADTRVFHTKNGRVIEMYNDGREVTATVDGEQAGYLHLRNDAEMDETGAKHESDWWVYRAWVNKPFRGQGIATAMYDYAYLAGFRPLKPSWSQTDGGAGVWNKRRGQVGPIDNWQLTESEQPTTLIDVAKHFLSVHDDLMDDDDDPDDFLDSEETAFQLIRRNYISGTCGAYAVALHDKTGYPIVSINGGLHIAVQAPDGDLMDFDGKQPLSAVLKRYGFGKRTPIVPWTREETVEHVRMHEDEEADGDPWDDINLAKWVLAYLDR